MELASVVSCNIFGMSGNEAVIDNERVILLDVLKEILPETKRASIAVGYFFISGFAAIMDSIEKIENGSDPNNVIRFLISPTTNRQTAEALLAENETHAEAKKAAEVEGDKDGRREARRRRPEKDAGVHAAGGERPEGRHKAR